MVDAAFNYAIKNYSNKYLTKFIDFTYLTRELKSNQSILTGLKLKKIQIHNDLIYNDESIHIYKQIHLVIIDTQQPNYDPTAYIADYVSLQTIIDTQHNKYEKEYYKIILLYVHYKTINYINDSDNTYDFELKHSYDSVTTNLIKAYNSLLHENTDISNYDYYNKTLKQHNNSLTSKKKIMKNMNNEVVYTHNILAYLLIIIIFIIIILLKNIYIFLIFLIILNILFEIKFNSIEKFNSNQIKDNMDKTFINILLTLQDTHYIKDLKYINRKLHKEDQKYKTIVNKTETIIHNKVHDINNNYIAFYNLKALINLLMRIIILLIIIYILKANIIGVILFIIILIIYLYSITYLNRTDALKKDWL